MVKPHPALAARRAEIDEVDRGLLELVARRRRLVAEIFDRKTELGLPLVDAEREAQLLASRRVIAEALGVAPELAEALFRLLLDDSHARARDRA
ncbi:chorismate mutase [Myxococcota bacterium]|nr:chorismate mutase [Myxococcota bacterium]